VAAGGVANLAMMNAGRDRSDRIAGRGRHGHRARLAMAKVSKRVRSPTPMGSRSTMSAMWCQGKNRAIQPNAATAAANVGAASLFRMVKPVFNRAAPRGQAVRVLPRRMERAIQRRTTLASVASAPAEISANAIDVKAGRITVAALRRRVPMVRVMQVTSNSRYLARFSV
jgi:hypothetical protein